MTSRLAEIAEQADVSEATVSRVLNGRPGVSEQARRKVLTAVDVLNYERPSRLRPRTAGLIGLVVPQLEDPVFPLFAQVIGSDLARQRYTPVLCAQTPDSPGEDEYVAMLRDRGVSGIVFVSGLHTDPGLDSGRYRDLVAQGLPIVLVNGHLDDVDAPSLSCDAEAAGRVAVDHLASLNHRRIGLVTGDLRHSPARDQRVGYREAMRDHVGLSDDELDTLEATTFTGTEGGYAGAKRLLDRDPSVSALVCGSDLMALGAIQAVRQCGRSVPDVSVVGYNDSVLMAHCAPPLTTVRQPVLAMGRTAARLLLDEIRGHPAPRGRSLFQPELVIRGSTRPRDAHG